MIEGDCNVEEIAGLAADPPICTPMLTDCDRVVLAFNEQQLEQFALEYFAQVPTRLDVSIENEESPPDGLLQIEWPAIDEIDPECKNITV